MYAKNISTFLLNLVKDKQVQINMEDEIIRDTLIARDGQIVNAAAPAVASNSIERTRRTMTFAPWILLAQSEGGQAGAETGAFLTSLFVLMLATFIGLEVIKNVSRLLHTPLMSLTNAIVALVNDISGVCNRRETFLITSRPMNVANISTNREVRKSPVSAPAWPPSDCARSIQGANVIVRLVLSMLFEATAGAAR